MVSNGRAFNGRIGAQLGGGSVAARPWPGWARASDRGKVHAERHGGLHGGPHVAGGLAEWVVGLRPKAGVRPFALRGAPGDLRGASCEPVSGRPHSFWKYGAAIAAMSGLSREAAMSACSGSTLG